MGVTPVVHLLTTRLDMLRDLASAPFHTRRFNSDVALRGVAWRWRSLLRM